MFLLSIILLTSILFIFLQPSLTSLLDPSYRPDLIKTFINDSTGKKAIDGPLFWETREFYNPGSFTYRHDGFSKKETTELLKKVNTEVNMTAQTLPFLSYESPKWHSVEMLVEGKTIAEVIKNPLNESEKVVLQTETELIYYTPSSIKIIFLKPSDEMQKSNGFFDYGGRDAKLVKDKYWLSISEVQL